jgi:hypothetical protein
MAELRLEKETLTAARVPLELRRMVAVPEAAEPAVAVAVGRTEAT